MRTFEGYVKFPNGRVQLMEVTAPDPLTARQMLQAMGECTAVAEKSKPVNW